MPVSVFQPQFIRWWAVWFITLNSALSSAFFAKELTVSTGELLSWQIAGVFAAIHVSKRMKSSKAAPTAKKSRGISLEPFGLRFGENFCSKRRPSTLICSCMLITSKAANRSLFYARDKWTKMLRSFIRCSKLFRVKKAPWPMNRWYFLSRGADLILWKSSSETFRSLRRLSKRDFMWPSNSSLIGKVSSQVSAMLFSPR